MYSLHFQGEDSGGGEVVSLDLDNVGGVFLVLIFGSAFAGLISLAELMFEVYVKEDRVSLTVNNKLLLSKYIFV